MKSWFAKAAIIKKQSRQNKDVLLRGQPMIMKKKDKLKIIKTTSAPPACYQTADRQI